MTISTYTELPLGVFVHSAGSTDDTVVVRGIRTAFETNPTAYSYSYGVYSIDLGDGADILYLTDLTSTDPAGINPRGRQQVNAGTGNDFVHVSSLDAATIFGGEGDDVITKVDLRSTSRNPVENGRVSGGVGGHGPRPDGLYQDAAWLDFEIIDGGAGDDQITTGNGSDWVYGGTGNDLISVGAGNNVVFGGDGNDTIIAEGLYYSYYSGGSLSFNYLSVHVAYGNNAVWGGEGNDTISVYYIKDGSIAINGEGGNDSITVQAAVGSWVTGGAGNDTIQISELVSYSMAYGTSYFKNADTIWADDGDDIIYTGRGDDLIVAGDGHDWIFGEYGNDALYGGPGSGVDDAMTDRFSFGSNRQRDLITDYNDLDIIYDFRAASSYADPTGKSDKIDLAALINGNSYLTYDAGNPFLQGELRVVASAQGSTVQANHAGTWVSFLELIGVNPVDLDIINQADFSGGFAGATGGDFLWYTG